MIDAVVFDMDGVLGLHARRARRRHADGRDKNGLFPPGADALAAADVVLGSLSGLTPAAVADGA